MKHIGKTPSELDKEFDEFKFTFRLKSEKKDGKVKVVATGYLNINGEQEQITAQSTKDSWNEAFDATIDKLNDKASNDE